MSYFLFKDYRETCFQSAKVEAEHIVIAMEIDLGFSVKAKRLIKKKQYHDEEPLKMIKVWYLQQKKLQNQLLHKNCGSEFGFFWKKKFDQLQNYEKTFGFLFDLKKLKLTDNDELTVSCVNREVFFKYGNCSDIDGKELCMELKLPRGSLPTNI